MDEITARKHVIHKKSGNILKKGDAAQKKGDPSNARSAQLAAQLIKGQSISVRTGEIRRVSAYTERLMRLARRGNARSRRAVREMLRDEAATSLLLEKVAPKLRRSTSFEFSVVALQNSRVSARTKSMKLTFKDEDPQQAAADTRIVVNKKKIDSVEVERKPVGAEVIPSTEPRHRSLAIIEGPIGAGELGTIGGRLGIPVRVSNNPDHWTLGLGSLTRDKDSPVLLRVVRRPSNASGVKIELAWRGRSPSSDIVAHVEDSIEKLQMDLAKQAPSVTVTKSGIDQRGTSPN